METREGNVPMWIGRIQDARIDMRNRLMEFEGEAVLLSERAEKMERQNAALLEALEMVRDADDDYGRLMPAMAREKIDAALALAKGGES